GSAALWHARSDQRRPRSNVDSAHSRYLLRKESGRYARGIETAWWIVYKPADGSERRAGKKCAGEFESHHNRQRTSSQDSSRPIAGRAVLKVTNMQVPSFKFQVQRISR